MSVQSRNGAPNSCLDQLKLTRSECFLQSLEMRMDPKNCVFLRDNSEVSSLDWGLGSHQLFKWAWPNPFRLPKRSNEAASPLSHAEIQIYRQITCRGRAPSCSTGSHAGKQAKSFMFLAAYSCL